MSSTKGNIKIRGELKNVMDTGLQGGRNKRINTNSVGVSKELKNESCCIKWMFSAQKSLPISWLTF